MPFLASASYSKTPPTASDLLALFNLELLLTTGVDGKDLRDVFDDLTLCEICVRYYLPSAYDSHLEECHADRREQEERWEWVGFSSQQGVTGEVRSDGRGEEVEAGGEVTEQSLSLCKGKGRAS